MLCRFSITPAHAHPTSSANSHLSVSLARRGDATIAQMNDGMRCSARDRVHQPFATDAAHAHRHRRGAQQPPHRRRCRTTVALEVHHLVPVRERPDLRLEQSNLVTLCGSCHMMVERR